MLKIFCRGFARLVGWRIVGDGPTEPRTVLIAAPHTSNWDFLFTVLAAGSWDVPFKVLGKEALFTAWYGPLIRKLGGIPVIRESPQGMVQQMADLILSSERIALAVAAPATRAWAPHWKSGFYQIALAADVPVAPAFVDWATKTVGVGEAIKLTGDITADMDIIREFYADKRGKFPANDGPIVLREELPPAPEEG